MSRCLILSTTLLLLLGFFPVPAIWAQDADNLVEATLGSDIDTASYYELVAWCRDLGLEDSGTRQTLQRRLYAHYGISPPEPESAPEGRTRLLEIKSAKETQYFTIEQIDEDYVLLLGDVLVEIQEEQATHRIRAHRVLLNETQSILSAEGGIEYTLIKGQEEEVFRGDSLTFDVESWEGVFFGGTIEADRVVGGETIRFRFEGESISRLEDNTVVIDRGRISSCDQEEDPHYHIRARKIWVLAPNEWAILHAVLYVGRVPMLYLPFFFRPGDEFFFHPAIGYRNREGQFIQTTTYLVGQKQRTSSALSFLAATEESTTQYELERRGLFLKPVSDNPIAVDENRFFKFMLDFYSRLGGFAGVEGSFPKASFKGGIGISRVVYDQGNYYTPWVDANGYESVWTWDEAYYFLGLRVPLRYGLESSWTIGGGAYTFSGRFEYFSDPFFPSDFYNRSEETGLSRLIGIEPLETAIEGERSSLTWELSGKADFSERIDTPLITSLAFTGINGSMTWSSKGEDQGDSPNRKFFYPVNLKLPRVSFQMLGDLLEVELPSVRGLERQSDATGEPPQELRPPAAAGVQPQRTSSSAAVEPLPALRPPQPKADEPVSLQKTPLSFGLSYQIRPNVTVEQTFNADNWEAPEDVNYDLKYTSLDTQGATGLDYSLRVLENVLSWSGNLTLSGSYRSLQRQSANQTQWETELLNAQTYSQFNLKLGNTLSYLPIADNPTFGKSSVDYNLGWIFYRYSRDDVLSTLNDPVYRGSGPEFTQDTVQQHSLQGALRWRMFDTDNSLSLTSQLYPRQGSVTGNLDFTVWILTTTVNSVLQDPDPDWGNGNAWEFQPVIVRETLRLADRFSLSEELQFDVYETPDEGLLFKSLTSVNLGNLTASLTYQWLEALEYDDLSSSFIPAGTPPRLLPSYISVDYNLTGRDRLYWHNRIRMNTEIDLAWYMNIQQFTDNNLSFSLTFSFWLYKFLELSITTTSYNNRTFLYFPPLAAEVGREALNPIEDLIRSFNFFNRSDRLNSSFNLQSIRVDLTHYLHDWNLKLSYEGKPELDTKSTPQQYQWGSTFSIVLQWLPIPELRSNVQGEYDVEDDTLDFSLRG